MDSRSDYQFFIQTKTKYSKHVQPGSLCYISNYLHDAEYIKHKKPTKLPVTGMGSSVDVEVLISDMSRLTTKEAELLYALDGEDNRLHWFKEKTALKSAVDLTVDTPVTVIAYRSELQGIIRYIGPFTEYHCRPTFPISGMFFGIELQGNDKGKGRYSGSTTSLFHCEKNNGLLVPFSKIRPTVVPTSLMLSAQQAPSQKLPNQITKGDLVSYFDDDSQGLVWVVVGVGDQEGEPIVCITTDNRTISVPMNCVARVTTEHEEPKAVLGVDSLIELTLSEGVAYGVIRWIGMVPGRDDTQMCGLELEEQRGVSDGMFKGKRFFSCPPNKALFVKLATCRADTRFFSPSSDKTSNPFAHQRHEDEDTMYEGPGTINDAISTEKVDQILIGRMKGIQGHCNSCYMDAALFSLFSCSSLLDSLLFKSLKPENVEIQNTLLHGIVNPLRSQGFVEGKHVMKLRQQLLDHGYGKTFTTEEKDPEEFLSIIMQHVMALDPLLQLSAAGEVQESYCYQIFLEQNHSLVLPTVQQLLELSFHSNALKLARAPSCLILQMPRFGKKFKMFDKIIPSLELNVTDLLTEGPHYCKLCGQIAHIECTECFKDPLFSQTGFKLFCKTCSAQVHSHPQRRAHRPSQLVLPRGCSEEFHPPRDKLELFAVLCIETSHYVSFVKHGPKSHDWIFFDSMADREGGLNGYNIPVIKACPEVGEYLDMPPAELANQVPRDMKGVAKRLFCDAYMYLYRNNDLAMYT